MNLDSFYLVQLIFGKYFRYFDTNYVTNSLQLQFYYGANCVPVQERVNITNSGVARVHFMAGHMGGHMHTT